MPSRMMLDNIRVWAVWEDRADVADRLRQNMLEQTTEGMQLGAGSQNEEGKDVVDRRAVRVPQ